MRIVITGATGFIGKHVIPTLQQAGHEIVTLGRSASANYRWDLTTSPPPEAFENAGAVIHLAGEPVAQKWTPEAKQRIRDSRVLGTERLIQALSVTRNRPQTFIASSAVGYYGDRKDEELPETAPPGRGFLADVCKQWEAKADLAAALGMRVVKVRTGIVLGPDGGALAKMLPQFRMGAGGRLGNGRQWMPWIHIDDIVGIYRHALEGTASGPLNGAAPGIVRNEDFAYSLGQALNRPARLAIPKFILKWVVGEMADVLVASQRMIPRATEESGYQFRHPDLAAALESLNL